MITLPQRVTIILVLLFISSASAKVIFSRRVYKEHGASCQQIWTWNPADGVPPGRDQIVYVTPQDLAPLPGGHRKRNVWVQQLMFFDPVKGIPTAITSGLTNNVDPSWCDGDRWHSKNDGEITRSLPR
jgi:hypothetical protein